MRQVYALLGLARRYGSERIDSLSVTSLHFAKKFGLSAES
jgi:hypothetical protein